MHSKLIRLQTALLTLALLFTVLIPVSAYAEGETAAAQATADGSTTISDPNTLNAWERTQAYNNATTGRIWADKTVVKDKIDLPSQGSIAVPKDDKDADFLVALSALSSYASTTTTNTQALDIVMVLDASGSMDDTMSGSTKRITALKNAVNAFIDSAAAQNAKITDPDKKIKLSIVKFAGKNKDTVGNDTYRDGRYTYNYSQIVKGLTVCDDTGAAALKTAVSGIRPAGATRADLGLKHAQTVLKSPRPNAKQVVIFFTDGEPNNSNGFDNDIASDAIKAAKSLKDAGTVVYTVGIFDGADPNDDVNAYETSKANKFMQAVSSNYPLATYTYIRSGLFGWGSYWSWNFGTKPAKANYYLAASSAEGLKNVFADIFTSVSTTPAGPTHVTDKPETDGYVTFDDPLGDYMEVKGFEAVAFSDQVFTKPSKETSGNVDTYTFTGTHDDTVSGAYPETADLSDIIITVTHGSVAEGDRVQVKIPASMLPLRYYKATNTDGTPKLEVNDAQPISVIYSVGLKKDVRDQIASGSFNDAALADYVAKNAQNDGTISFYSNKFDKNKTAADDVTTIGSTTATFTPATSNNFYYHTEDTLLYTKTGEGKDAKYTPATSFEKSTIYYYELNYLHQNPDKRDETLVKKDMVPMHIDEESAIEKCIGKNADGNYYIKAGTKKGSLPSAIDSQLGDKKDTNGNYYNPTGTAKRRIDFQWDLDAHKGVLYLGNNGKLTMNATGSLKVTKKVEAAEGLTPNPDTDPEFTMQFTLAGENLDPYAEYQYTVTGIAGTKTIKSGETFTLKANQTAEIVGLPAGSTYTITEKTPPAGYTPEITNGTDEVTAGTAKEVTVTNTYEPAEIVVNPTDDNYPFKGEKILQGRRWQLGDSFTFRLEATNGAPLPKEAGNNSYIEREVKKTILDVANKPVSFNFGSVTFTKPGTYMYDITEVAPADKDKIAGVSYDSSYYRVTVTITDDGSGSLKMKSAHIEHISGDDQTTDAKNVTFTNIFKDDTETLNIEAKKVYKDELGNSMNLTNGQFHFKLEPATVNENNVPLADNNNIPMPGNAANGTASTINNAAGEITFDDITYTLANDKGKTYYYLLTEKQDNKKANIDYSQEQYLIKAEVSYKYNALNVKYILTVTTTYYKWNDNQWKQVTANEVTFTNIFTGKAEATLGVSKSISGRDWKDGEEFTFTLTAKDNAPMPTDGSKTATATKTAPTANFGTITYKKAGTYTYTIKETSTPANGMTNAADVTATVTVALKDDNSLEATVEYSNPDTENGKAKFVNTYNAQPYTPKAKELFQVEKELNGRPWNGTDTFYFTLSREGNAPLPGNTTASVNSLNKTAYIGGDQQLVFDAVGKYTYHISEDSGSIPGVTYDTTDYKVVVTVKDEGNGKLSGETHYYYKRNGETDYTATPEGSKVATFVNTYSASEVTVNLYATKILDVQVGTRTLNAG